jgi:hypothetical protein
MMRTSVLREWKRAAFGGALIVPPPDVALDFVGGRGIPVANGGLGGMGSELVSVISPQDGGSGARLVRALRYWDPEATWTPGEPIFVPKQADRLVGWPGPRTDGYWTGPMPSRSSTSETVAVYSSVTGLTVTTVAGGVVGPDAIRCDVGAGQSGDGWAAGPAATMSSGWTVDANGHGTVCYLHAVVELLGAIGNHRFRFGLYDHGSSQFVEVIAQRYDEPDQLRAGKVFRGVGPRGGQLYEIWALARLVSTPVGPISAQAYLLRSGSASNPARTVIVHGSQTYFIDRFRFQPIIGVPPFFSYARGTPVVWTAEDLRVNDVTGPWSAGIRADTTPYAVSSNPVPDGVITRLVSRNGSNTEGFYTGLRNLFTAFKPHLEGYNPYFNEPQPFDGRAVVAVDESYNRRVTTNGNTVHDGGPFVDYPANPTHLIIGGGDGYWYGQYYRFMLWRRALTDAELLRAFSMLGGPLL